VSERKEAFEEAFRFLSEAMATGNLDALYNLATMYFNGYVPGSHGPDSKAGLELFKEGARKGNAVCMGSYARCLEAGIGVKQNQLEAESWYRKAAEEGYKPAIDWRRNHYIGVP
jgi:TPR repeat protein